MLQHGLLTIYGIGIFSIILSAGAQSTAVTEDCLEFTKISRNDITISWNKICFNNATSFRVEIIVPEQDPCNVDSVPCGEDEEGLCETTLQTLACDSSASPCVDITVNIIGGEETKSISTHFAPYLRSSEWKLDNSSIDDNDILDARWGPPNSIDYTICATRAVAIATCNAIVVDNKPWETDDVLATQGNAILNVAECTGDIILTVIYTAGVSYKDEDVLTETKATKTFPGPTVPPTEPSTATESSTDSTTAPHPVTKSSELTGGEIAGIVIGVLFGLALFIGVPIGYCYKKKICCFEN